MVSIPREIFGSGDERGVNERLFVPPPMKLEYHPHDDSDLEILDFSPDRCPFYSFLMQNSKLFQSVVVCGSGSPRGSGGHLKSPLPFLFKVKAECERTLRLRTCEFGFSNARAFEITFFRILHRFAVVEFSMNTFLSHRIGANKNRTSL